MGRQEEIHKKVRAYRKRFYWNAALRGILIFLAGLLTYLLAAFALEYNLWMNSWTRGALFFLLLGGAGYFLWKLVFRPVLHMVNEASGMKILDAAENIGKAFPQVGDRLINMLQLERSARENELAMAGVMQKGAALRQYDFSTAIDLRQNRKYLTYLLPVLLLWGLIFAFKPEMLSDGSQRLTQFHKEFIPAAPFEFNLVNNSLQAFRNEDFEVGVTLTGASIPENVYLVSQGRKIKMAGVASGTFQYNFKKVQADRTFYFEGAGFRSVTYHLEVLNRPNIRDFEIRLDFPAYLGRSTENVSNSGNLEVPEGTKAGWLFNTRDTDELELIFENEGIKSERTENQIFRFEKILSETQNYQIGLQNPHSKNKERIQYFIKVIKDAHPEISVEAYHDTVYYQYIALAGNIRDDHGIQKLEVRYSIEDEKGNISEYERFNLQVGKGQTSQSIFERWALSDLDLKEGSVLRYYLQVWDNDAVNGSKSARTPEFRFKIPGKQDLKKEIDESIKKTEENLEESKNKAARIREEAKALEERLRGKKNMEWQDEKRIMELIEQRKQMEDAINQLKEMNESTNQKRDRFSKENDPMKEKSQQLQEIMEDLLDDETRELYDELEKLLEENKDSDTFRKMLEQLSRKEQRLERDLERTMELFKRLQLEFKIEAALDELKDQIAEQAQLLEETQAASEDSKTPDADDPEDNAEKDDGDSGSDQESSSEDSRSENKEKQTQSPDIQDLNEKQKSLIEGTESLKEEIKEIEKKNQDLKSPQSMPDMDDDIEDTKEEQEQSRDALEKNDSKGSQKAQEGALGKMKQMAKKMEGMMGGMQMDQMQENLDHLRYIMHNLIKLSFDQESLMNEFREVQQSDPRFVTLSQQQLKIRDDAQILQDSLLSLAGRVLQIQSFVTREVSNMNQYIEETMHEIRERNKFQAVAKQQFTMTSINNLALLLDDVLDQMQDSMAASMGKGEDGDLDMSEIQKKLNEQTEDLKKSGKTGRELSEALAQLAAEQARIRKMLEEMEGKYGEEGKQLGNGVGELMEETELDLVNKRITNELIERQRNILTRLLEAENSMRERDMDEQRKGETATDYDKALPKAFEEYFNLKEKEIELLKTVPPRLFPYYRNEVQEYFNRLNDQ